LSYSSVLPWQLTLVAIGFIMNCRGYLAARYLVVYRLLCDQEQASWVCQCDDSIVHHLEQDFKKTLQQQTPLEQWAAWLEGVVNQALGPYESSPDFPKAARQFLLKWSFYRYDGDFSLKFKALLTNSMYRS
jgi:hypothetical protein